MDYAFEFVQEYGICTESDYPYVSGDGYVPSCNDSKRNNPYEGTKGVSHTDVPSGNTDALKSAAAK